MAQTESDLEMERYMQSPEIVATPACQVGEIEAERRQPLLAAAHEWLHRLQELQEAPPDWQTIDYPTGADHDSWEVEEARTWLELAFEATGLLSTHITTVADSLDIALTCEPASPEHDSYVLEAVNTFNTDVRAAIGGAITVDRIARILDECMADGLLENVEFATTDIREIIEQGRRNGDDLDETVRNILPRMPEIISEAIHRLKEEYSRTGRMTEYFNAVQPLKAAMKSAGVAIARPRNEAGLDRAGKSVSLESKTRQNEHSTAVHRELAERIDAPDIIELFDRLAHYQTDYDNLVTYLNDKHNDDATRVRQLAIQQAQVFNAVTATAARLREAIVAKIYTNGEAAVKESFAKLPEPIQDFVNRCLNRAAQIPTTPEIDATALEIVGGGQRIQDFLDAKALVEGHFLALDRRGAKYTSASMRDQIEHGVRVEKIIYNLIGTVASRWDHVINSEPVKAALSLEQRKASTEKFNDLLQGVFPGIRYATDLLQE